MKPIQKSCGIVLVKGVVLAGDCVMQLWYTGGKGTALGVGGD